MCSPTCTRGAGSLVRQGLCRHRGFFSGPLTKQGTNLLQQHLGLALTSLESPGKAEAGGVVSAVWMGVSGASCLPQAPLGPSCVPRAGQLSFYKALGRLVPGTPSQRPHN